MTSTNQEGPGWHLMSGKSMTGTPELNTPKKPRLDGSRPAAHPDQQVGPDGARRAHRPDIFEKPIRQRTGSLDEEKPKMVVKEENSGRPP